MLERVSIGRTWRPPRARDDNATAEAVEAIQQSGLIRPAHQQLSIPHTTLWLRNDSGGDLIAGRVLEIGDLIIDDVDSEYPWFEGLTPTSDTTTGIAITLHATPANGIEECLVSGSCYARANVTDLDHAFAETTAGSTILQSATSGRVKIIWLETVAIGEQWARVLLPVFGSGGGSPVYFGKLASDLATATADDMTIWVDGVATANTIEVMNRTGQTLKANILMKATQGIGCTEYLVEPYELEACP